MDDRTLKLWERLDREYSEYTARFPIDRTKLSEEVLQHSESRRRVCENWVYAKRIRRICIRGKATQWATRSTETRSDQWRDHKNGNGIKPTKDTVDNAVRSDGRYLDACRDLVDIEETVELWEELAGSYKGRGYDLRDLVKIHLAGTDRDYIKDEPGPLRRSYYRAPDKTPDTEEATQRRKLSDVKVSISKA